MTTRIPESKRSQTAHAARTVRTQPTASFAQTLGQVKSRASRDAAAPNPDPARSARGRTHGSPKKAAVRSAVTSLGEAIDEAGEMSVSPELLAAQEAQRTEGGVMGASAQLIEAQEAQRSEGGVMAASSELVAAQDAERKTSRRSRRSAPKPR